MNINTQHGLYIINVVINVNNITNIQPNALSQFFIFFCCKSIYSI
nr:MAG TPA: hypothetical protein [Caudoviricetes sp.]